MNKIDKFIIPPDDSKKNKGPENGITKVKFDSIIKEVYETMIHFSRMRGELLTEDNPIYIGNVSFWFETNPHTNNQFIKFSQPVGLWKEDEIRYDLDLHFHNLFYGSGE